MIKVLDVIWVYDETIRPPAPKMWVCLEPDLGLFFRINTEQWRTPIKLLQCDHSNFLTHDSYLECGQPIELTENELDDALRSRGVIGRVDERLAPDILAVIESIDTVSPNDKTAIAQAFSRMISEMQAAILRTLRRR